MRAIQFLSIKLPSGRRDVYHRAAAFLNTDVTNVVRESLSRMLRTAKEKGFREDGVSIPKNPEVK